MSKAERHEAGRCPACDAAVWSDHPYTWCSECGSPLPQDLRAKLPAIPRAAPPSRTDGVPLEVMGREVPCPVCGHDRFWTRRTLMDTRGAAFFGLDWAQPTAENYVCVRCGHVLWFLRR